ncbi:Baseplate J-like protein [Neomoorella glycerini]|uniref:Baseplate J-like protein n=1 Tax=Neomoorella glycerini TaxID=55779 RepID=A0A6I5ZPJ9_9FIRM|nr:baseplate J/gp47 family protein [Moorella glycerini]QGP91716.1 Baseplate J-like protein [Moorella glycerini]
MKPEDLLELKTFEELMDEAVQELQSRQFKIKNFRPGRIFYTLLELAMLAVASLFKLLPKVLDQLFLSTAKGAWLDIVAQDRAGVFRKQPQKTQGVIRAGRNNPAAKAVLPVGAVVTTEEDADGNVLRYLVTKRTVLDAGVAEATVPVEAELGGARYNVGPGRITRLATFQAGIDYVTNDADWITLEGTDLEDDESLRRRAMNKRTGISYGGNQAMYQSMAEEITGVARARVNTKQPRGEGTIDVVIIGTEGVPTQAVIDKVKEKLDNDGSAIADIAVYPAEELVVDITATLYIDPVYGDPAVIDPKARSLLADMFKVTPVEGVQQINIDYGLDRSLIVANLRAIERVFSVELLQPAEDIKTTFKQILVLGQVNLTILGADV